MFCLIKYSYIIILTIVFYSPFHVYGGAGYLHNIVPLYMPYIFSGEYICVHNRVQRCPVTATVLLSVRLVPRAAYL